MFNLCLVLLKFMLKKKSGLIFHLLFLFLPTSFFFLNYPPMLLFWLSRLSWVADYLFFFLFCWFRLNLFAGRSISSGWLFRRRRRWWWRRRLLSYCFFFGDHHSIGIIGFGDDNFFCESKIGVLSSSPLFGHIVVASISTVKIIVSFEPLSKLKIVLILGFW